MVVENITVIQDTTLNYSLTKADFLAWSLEKKLNPSVLVISKPVASSRRREREPEEQTVDQSKNKKNTPLPSDPPYSPAPPKPPPPLHTHKKES